MIQYRNHNFITWMKPCLFVDILLKCTETTIASFSLSLTVFHLLQMGPQCVLSLLMVLSCVLTSYAEDASVERRASQMGFMGMRGKKDVDDKRTPSMGFSAMRGKKDSLFDFSEFYPEEKRGPSMGFAAMRGKKDSLYDLSGLYPEEKRGPNSMGFMGMRGKKEFFDPAYDLELGYDKRAPSMGFTAMRGKKAPSGFMGMRGKKFDYLDDDLVMDDDLWPMDEFDKRAPAAGFFGTRGKKMPQNSGFFGMRGKKGPSGFMGMRGKKAPSGFMGMRGKKDDNSEDLENMLAMLSERQNERSKRGEPTLFTGD